MKRSIFICAISILLVLTELIAACPIADADLNDEEIIQQEAIQQLFDDYIARTGVNPDLISVGYVYTATGETWYHNEDKWYYSASLYKVPLMMLLAEREANGELDAGSEINGMTLSAIEEEVLISSNNPIAYSTMLYIAQPNECRKMFQRYSSLSEDYYSWEFYSYSYFTARFVTDVMKTLYENSDCFPRLIDYMKQAQPNHYFRLELEDAGLEIAQKYGSYHDEDEKDWNHTTGIIYTPTPFILTVMTRYGGMAENVISDLAVLFREYTLQADQRLLQMRNASAEGSVSETSNIP